MNPIKSLAILASYIAVFILGWVAHIAVQPILPQKYSKNPTAQANTITTTAPKNTQITPINTGSDLTPKAVARVIYEDHMSRSNPKTMQVTKVSVIHETNQSLLLEIEYQYTGAIPASEVQLFGSLHTSYTYLGNFKVRSGKNKERMLFNIIESDMQKKFITEFETSLLSLRFEHYPSGAYKGSLEEAIIPFNKHWKISK
jgi:hypothetical protein